jgi:hypothetical protein
VCVAVSFGHLGMCIENRNIHLRMLADSGCSLIVTMLKESEFASAAVLETDAITRVHIPCQGTRMPVNVTECSEGVAMHHPSQAGEWKN